VHPRFFAICPINIFAKEYLERDSGNYVESALESKTTEEQSGGAFVAFASGKIHLVHEVQAN
jgi:hypothetical protein